MLVDPLDPDAIAAGLAEVIDRREELRPLGLERASAFGWHDVARETLGVYREAALAGGIERALADHQRLREAGLARAAHYSWAETARGTLEVYRELLA